MENEDTSQIPFYIDLRFFLFACNFHFITCECEVLATLNYIGIEPSNKKNEIDLEIFFIVIILFWLVLKL